MDDNKRGNLAVLIDARCISPKIVSEMLVEIAKTHNVALRRIYGNWTPALVEEWSFCSTRCSLVQIQQSSALSGATMDIAIDVLDLLHGGGFSGYCLVSSHGDLARLAARVRNQGLEMFGFGERGSDINFVTACNEFFFFNRVSTSSADTHATMVDKGMQTADPPTKSAAPMPPMPAPPMPAQQTKVSAKPPRTNASRRSHTGAPSGINLNKPLQNGAIAKTRKMPKDQDLTAAKLKGHIRDAINSVKSSQGGFVALSLVGEALNKRGVRAASFGYAKLTALMEASGIVEMKMEKNNTIIRLKPTQ